jgi:ribulose-phosphate 3-epimerase
MTVEPGFGGQKFLNNQVRKIEEVKKMIGNKKIDIEVDGGINKESAKIVKKAGANVLVSGSTIFSQKNYNKIINELRFV